VSRPEREFPVTFHPYQGAIVDMPTVCPLCASGVGPSYDIHMVLAHPETRPQPPRTTDKAPKKKKR
jgi:hypothetical protein